MPATVVYREKDEKPDGSRYEMVAWQVPVSEELPQRLKYSFQYMDAAGDTLLRYDNGALSSGCRSASSTPTRGRHHKTGVHRPLRPDRGVPERGDRTL
jgi:hypothetical protein